MKDSTGEPNGILLENAGNILVIPLYTRILFWVEFVYWENSIQSWVSKVGLEPNFACRFPQENSTHWI